MIECVPGDRNAHADLRKLQADHKRKQVEKQIQLEQDMDVVCRRSHAGQSNFVLRYMQCGGPSTLLWHRKGTRR